MPNQARNGLPGVSPEQEKSVIMCLAVPVKVISIQGEEAEVESGGTTYRASISLVPEVKPGDYVLLHTGYAISIIDSSEAEQTLKLIREMETAAENDDR